jgi:hypothetical protein
MASAFGANRRSVSKTQVSCVGQRRPSGYGLDIPPPMPCAFPPIPPIPGIPGIPCAVAVDENTHPAGAALTLVNEIVPELPALLRR